MEISAYSGAGGETCDQFLSSPVRSWAEAGVRGAARPVGGGKVDGLGAGAMRALHEHRKGQLAEANGGSRICSTRCGSSLRRRSRGANSKSAPRTRLDLSQAAQPVALQQA